jgi:hypothetical protein
VFDHLEPEQWRIITESGIMDQVKARDAKAARTRRETDDELDRDYVFEGIFFSIPTACLFIVMDILVHRQYGETYTGGDVLRKVIKIFPGTRIQLSTVVFIGQIWKNTALIALLHIYS